MKTIFFLFFFLLLSCSTVKKEYVCGDRPCIDKKEFDEFFAKNLIIEIIFEDEKKKKSVDLVTINTEGTDLKKDNKKISRQQVKLNKKLEKDKLKAEKNRLLEERKIKKAKEKLRIKNEKRIAKSSKSNSDKDTTKSILDKTVIDKNNNKNTTFDKKIKKKSFEIQNTKNICDDINDCDIDKIAEILVEKGKNKPFPNIAAN